MEHLLSERLALRPIRPIDFPFLHRLLSDPVATRLWWHGRPLEEHETRQQIARAEGLFTHPATGAWILVDRLHGEDAGMGDTWFGDDAQSCELGCILAPRFQQNGFATTFARWAIDNVFANSEVGRVVATAHPENEASIRTLQKCGFTHCGYSAEKVRLVFEIQRSAWRTSFGQG